MDGMQLVNQRRVIAIGLLHSGQTVYARAPIPGTAPGTYGPPVALREAWQINNVSPESRLFDSRMVELCTPPPVEPEPEVPVFLPDASLPPDAQAAQVLLHVLESGEPVPATVVAKAAKRYRIARRALKKAQLALSIRPKKTPTGWTWALPKIEMA